MLNVTFKTITGEAFKLELEEATSVGEVKEKIAATKGESHAKELQKLIYNGKILEDGQKIGELNIDEKKFVVVMVSRKKVEPAATNASDKPATGSATTQKTAAASETKGISKDSSVDPQSSAPSAPAAGAASSAVEIPPEHEKTVENIQAMGYPKEEVIRALKAAFFNADRAVEYLCTGIPEALNIAGEGAAGEGGGHESGEEEGGEEANSLEFLANSPQFQHLRELVRTDPSILPQVVGTIAAQNPELMNMIRTNQDAFLQLLNASAAEEGEGGAGGVAAAAGQQPAGEGNIADQAASGVMTIAITPQDREAINRLMALGFPESLAVEAYLACDKNEELAANYILQRLEEFNAEQGGGGN